MELLTVAQSNWLLKPTFVQAAERMQINGIIEEWGDWILLEAGWNVMAQPQNPDFVFRRNGQVHLNGPGGVSSVDYWQPSCMDQC